MGWEQQWHWEGRAAVPMSPKPLSAAAVLLGSGCDFVLTNADLREGICAEALAGLSVAPQLMYASIAPFFPSFWEEEVRLSFFTF